MGQKSASLDKDGGIICFFDSVDSPAPANSNLFELTDEEWQLCIAVKHKVENGKLVPVLFVPMSYTPEELAEQINCTIEQIYKRWTRFQAEYEFREKAAIAYKESGYVGDGGVWITSFSGPAGIPPKMACDLILSQSENLRTAQRTLGALRMRKYEVVALTGQAAQEKFDEINVAINDAVKLID